MPLDSQRQAFELMNEVEQKVAVYPHLAALSREIFEHSVSRIHHLRSMRLVDRKGPSKRAIFGKSKLRQQRQKASGQVNFLRPNSAFTDRPDTNRLDTNGRDTS